MPRVELTRNIMRLPSKIRMFGLVKIHEIPEKLAGGGAKGLSEKRFEPPTLRF